MAEPREIHVKLTADTTQYVDAMNRAREATELLRAAGVDPNDLTSALGASLQLADAAALSDADAAKATAAAMRAFKLTGHSAPTIVINVFSAQRPAE